MQPNALILHASGTNRDHDAAQAFSLAGALPEIVHLNQLRSGQHRFSDYQILVLPGGFSYADALGAGKLLALDLKEFFAAEVGAFVASGKPVIGICNGFQALVKSGILPDPQAMNATPLATLTFNASGHFECRWVQLKPLSQACLWTRGLTGLVFCPVAHGEGNFIARDAEVADSLRLNDQIALVYSRADGQPARGSYPENPNGSAQDIAGICNTRGNVLGLMPHPEDHIFAHQHPRWTRGETNGSGLPLFVNGVRYAAEM
jgi:phosphoribosylformylglycinamidine synthase subunit PurQ / glutaminase